MLAGVGTGAMALVFADLQNIETAQGLAIESWSLPAPISNITPLPGNLAFSPISMATAVRLSPS